MTPTPSLERDLTLAAAGVSRAAANALAEQIAPLLRSTDSTVRKISIPDFCSALDLGHGRALLATTDGVGTKRALMADRLEDLGRDLVAYNVNDIGTAGVQPLALLNYLSFGSLESARAFALIKGMAAACQEAGCVLLGGETAEHPGIQGPHQIDLAAFAVALAAQNELVTGHLVSPGDEIIGVASTGPQASGFSLIRHAFAHARMAVPDHFLTPTAVYISAMRTMREHCEVHAIMNICDGGLTENLPRGLPAPLRAVVDVTSWPRPAWVTELMSLGCREEELRKVVNLGIGYAFVVSAATTSRAIHVLSEAGYSAWGIGSIEAATGGERTIYAV
jgi:phosphoribosylformylglycinamidine cyclo-ligase